MLVKLCWCHWCPGVAGGVSVPVRAPAQVLLPGESRAPHTTHWFCIDQVSNFDRFGGKKSLNGGYFFLVIATQETKPVLKSSYLELNDRRCKPWKNLFEPPKKIFFKNQIFKILKESEFKTCFSFFTVLISKYYHWGIQNSFHFYCSSNQKKSTLRPKAVASKGW